MIKKVLITALILTITIFLIKNYLRYNKAPELSATPDRVSLVDTGRDLCYSLHGSNCEENHNILVRGSRPLNEGGENEIIRFRHALAKQLAAYLEKSAPENLMPSRFKNLAEVLASYRIVIVNSVYGVSSNKTHESERRLVMYEFNATHSPNTALPIPGEIYNIAAPFEQDKIALVWHPITLQIDYLSALSTLVQSSGELTRLLLSKPADGRPLLIFYHCMAGKDRTGAVTTAYYMTYGGYPYNENVRSGPMDYYKAIKSNNTYPDLYPNNKGRKLAYAYCKTLPNAKENCQVYWMTEVKLFLNFYI